jgi:hypothetical protein
MASPELDAWGACWCLVPSHVLEEGKKLNVN